MRLYTFLMSIFVAFCAFSAQAKPKNQLGSADLSTTRYHCETEAQEIEIRNMRSQTTYAQDYAALADVQVISKQSGKILLTRKDLEMTYMTWAKGVTLADKITMKAVNVSHSVENFENNGDREFAFYSGISALSEDDQIGALFILFGDSYRIDSDDEFCKLVD